VKEGEKVKKGKGERAYKGEKVKE
jgi:hypothetical protein